MSHLLISAAHKSSGKTVLSVGICSLLKNKGLSVQAFKKGPDYIDPMWLSKATQQNCYNLDFWTQTQEEIKSDFASCSVNADISIVEGNKGLHDGLATDGSNSNAALAKLLRIPVILILDTRGTIRGVAPLLLGYQQFDPDVNFAGVILNFVGGNRHEAKLTNVIEQYTDIPILGSVQKNSNLELVERYLGLMPSNEDLTADNKITSIASCIKEQIDLDQILNITKITPTIEPNKSAQHYQIHNTLKIAYAKDEAFGFYYADDLEEFARQGAHLIPFDTLNDSSLPAANALFIGGGFPEKRMHQLAENKLLKKNIFDAINEGMPSYAECGGLMYLCSSITYESETSEMVGIIDADCELHEKPIGRGYTLLEKSDCHIWKNTSLDPIPGHEFHYSKLSRLANNYQFAYKVKRGFGIDGKHDGIIYKNLIACYAHQRNTSRNKWISNFIEFIKNCS